MQSQLNKNSDLKMLNNKDLKSSNKEHRKMKINIPPNLNYEEIKSFNEIVKPQLEELYSYDYDKFEFGIVKIFISKDEFPKDTKRPNFEEIKNILSKIPEKHLKFISEIYFVSHHCRDDTDKEIKGRTLPIIYKIIIYPKSQNKLKSILTHEIGHVFYDIGLTFNQKAKFIFIAYRAYPKAQTFALEEKQKYIQEFFSIVYDDYINEQKYVNRNPLLIKFLKELWKD